MEGAAGRCLSDLPDDLLQHILFFAPAKEGATTAVLSRRWRWLWRMSGAVNLDSRDAFLRGGEEALAAASSLGCPIKRLTVCISKIDLMMRYNELGQNPVEAIVSNPAARRVEELQIDAKNMDAECMLSVGSLPSHALRVLRLRRCSLTTAPPPGAAFPMLVELHLEGCIVRLADFQAMVDVAPGLSTLHLKSSMLWSFKFENNATIHDHGDGGELLVTQRLVLPAVTTVYLLAECRFGGDDEGTTSIELDVPRLQYIRYTGSVQKTEHFSLKLLPHQASSSNMIQVDLELTNDDNYSPTPACNLFWQFIQNFRSTKLLKLKLDDTLTMDDLALVEKTHRDKLLGGLSFHLLEQLELEGKYKYKPGFKTSSMVMLADLFGCCPIIRDLKLRFGKKHEMPLRMESSVDKEAGLHFDKSVNGFRKRKRNKSMVSLGGQNNDVNYEAAGLTGDSFSCLWTHLQRVRLHFFMDEPNCLELQLAKYIHG